MVAETERELDDGVGRVGVAGAREYARAADVEVRDAVHAAVGVDHALARVGAHPGAAHVMVPADPAALAEWLAAFALGAPSRLPAWRTAARHTAETVYDRVAHVDHVEAAYREAARM